MLPGQADGAASCPANVTKGLGLGGGIAVHSPSAEHCSVLYQTSVWFRLGMLTLFFVNVMVKTGTNYSSIMAAVLRAVRSRCGLCELDVGRRRSRKSQLHV